MGNEIYCYGGIDIYNAVFNAIAMMNGDRSFMQSLVAVGVLVGGFWTMVTLIFGDFIKPFLHWIIPMAVLQAAFLTPTATVQLIDVVQEGRHEVVDNVPYGLALIAGSLSRISQRITEKTELYFHSVEDIKYSKTGGIFAANLVGNQKLMTIQDEDFADNMRSFIGQCVLYDLALGRKYTMKQLRNTHDIWGLISANASPARSFMWKERGNRGDILTCAEGVQRFNASWGAHVDQTACAVGAKMYPNHDASPYAGGVQGRSFYRTGMCKSPLARNEFIKFLPFQYAALAGIGQQAPEILKQQMMISAIVDAQDHASAVVGNMPNFAARKAYFQQRSSYENIGLLAADTLPIMRAVLELICYAIFLFIVPILVLPMGYKVLISWTQTVLWLAMWPPMYAVLHLIMVSAIAMKTKAFVGISNSAGITIASSLGVQNISADMAAMAGYLSMSIPFICIAVVKGVSSFVHMAGSLGAVSQGAATSAATEALTGNYSLGNTSMDNHSFGNMNQLSQSYNSSLSTGNTSLQEGHSTYATDANGNMVAKEQRHDLGFSANIAKNRADSLRTVAAQEYSMGQSLMQSSEQSVSSAIDNTVRTGESLANSENNIKGWEKRDNVEMGEAMTKTAGIVKKFASDNHISNAQAATVMAKVATPGIMETLFGVSASADVSSMHNSQELISKAKETMQSTNFDKHASIAAQASQHLARTEGFESAQSFARDQQTTAGQASRDSSMAQKHLENSKKHSKEADHVDSNSLNINREATHDLIKYVAGKQSPYSNGNSHGEMGERAALSLLNNKREEAQPYINEWMRERMPAPSMPTPETLKKEYDAVPIASTVNRGIVDEADKMGRRTISHDLANEGKVLKQDVGMQITEAQQAIGRDENKEVTQTWNAMQNEHERQSKSVGVAGASRGAVGSMYNVIGAANDVVVATGKSIQQVMGTFSEQGMQVDNAFDGVSKEDFQQGKTVKIVQVKEKEEPMDLKAMNKKSSLKN